MEFLQQNMQLIMTALIIILVLMIAMAVWRAFSPRMSGRRGQRLGLSEYYELDKTRRLVLVRRDNVEHLILIGGGQDIVIEPNIHGSHATPVSHAGGQSEQPPAGTARPAPRPPTFSDRKPPPLRPVGESGATPLRPREEPEL